MFAIYTIHLKTENFRRMKFVVKLNLARAFVFNDLSKYVIIVQMSKHVCETSDDI